MIAVILSQQLFENDIGPLVKAFFPRDEVRVVIGEEISADMSLRAEFEEGNKVSLIWNGEDKIKKNVKWNDDRIELKNEIKRTVYHMLSKACKKELPWGSLTGIRPTKIALGKMLEWDNISSMSSKELDEKRSELTAYIKEKYLVSDEKTALAIEVAGLESTMLFPIDRKSTFSLYVGIPFCPTICAYCSFASSPISDFKGRVEGYLLALKKEITETARIWKDKTLKTIYFGGGTPTSITAGQLDDLMSHVLNSFDISGLEEFTVEAGRPDSLSPEKLEVISKQFARIKPSRGRISVNPQTMNQKTLNLIGRSHTTEQVKNAIAMARSAGIETINMDLILALPEETTSDVAHTMEEIKALSPDNLTIHSLALKTKARLSQEWEKWQDYTYRNSDAIMELATNAARDLGMHPYYLYRQKNIAGNLENVGYSVPGKEGFYNQLIMEQWHDIAACGANGASRHVYFDGKRGWQSDRAENVKNIEEYISRIDEMIGRKERMMGI
ncbi:MAG: coproporphyrinogen dehydrogenase HemZ [Lachnospiraceae bacterium]|nr:coproporphyrinogen dehydrogenase HemZ [Lachnospiraceae bacterium]